VILVEPLDGSSVRRDGPFIDGAASIERSIPFAYYNAGKRSIALDPNSADGQQVFKRLVRGADLLIESEKPGLMASRGLDYPAVSAEAPNLVMTSITPFGQTGPYAQYECDDIVALAIYLMAGGIASTRFWENTARWLMDGGVAGAAQLLAGC
jgi:benzylsuccinate CoA-transferase BbsE subunit